MVLPIILGKAFLDAKDIVAGETMGEEVSGSVLIIGLLAAFLSGIVACNWMVALVKRSQLKYFSYYCFVVAAIVLISQLV
jgi:undecaprenyl-diphosphatase